MLGIQTDEYFMRQAYLQAERAFEEGEVPIGAVVVCENVIIGKGYNQTERLQDPTAHAEMIAVTAACDYMGNKYLSGCSLFVTVEPCVMCAGAMRWAQVDRVVYGLKEPKTGFSRFGLTMLHPKTMIQRGVMEEECQELMQRFFRERR